MALELNLSKTKIMVFNKQGDLNFTFKGKKSK